MWMLPGAILCCADLLVCFWVYAGTHSGMGARRGGGGGGADRSIGRLLCGRQSLPEEIKLALAYDLGLGLGRAL